MKLDNTLSWNIASFESINRYWFSVCLRRTKIVLFWSGRHYCFVEYLWGNFPRRTIWQNTYISPVIYKKSCPIFEPFVIPLIIHQSALLTNTHCIVVVLNHWGRVTHICVSQLINIVSDNGLSPDRRQAIIWNNDGILLFGPVGRNFSEILIEIYTFSFRKMRLKMSSGKWRPSCLVAMLRSAPLFRRRYQFPFVYSTSQVLCTYI